MRNKFAFIDFEYFDSNEKDLNLVCCSLSYDGKIEEYWLSSGRSDKECLYRDLLTLEAEGYIFVAYQVEAEARSFLSLHLKAKNFKWIDLYLEWRMLTNHNDKLAYGKQLIDGKVKRTFKPKPKWERKDEIHEKQDHSKVQHSLASCCYKLLDVKVDTDFKDQTRDIILSRDVELIEKNKRQIMEYCTSDIRYLPQLFDAMLVEYKNLLSSNYDYDKLIAEMLTRGDYSARTAIMVSKGYPIDTVATKAFSNQLPDLLWELQTEINDLFPDLRPFRLNKNLTYSWSQKDTKEWVKENHDVSKWRKTDKGGVSLSRDAFKDFYNYSHDYPEDSFGAQIVRYLTFKREINGFSPTAKNSFWDYVGSDGRARSWFGIYGAQSSRSQPKATGFLFLKSAWMRALAVPPKGKMLCGIDYGSQEFLLGALMSQDINMYKAYKSGDVYLYFAKLAGAVPWEGERKDYKEERDLFKSTTLGISYGMWKYKLAQKITEDTGRPTTPLQAEKLIKKFEKAYPSYNKYRKRVVKQYTKDKRIALPCGWTMWGDNDNDKSVQNMPVQGMGASIMRKAVCLAQDAGLDVIMTLHDAIYIECDLKDWEAVNTLKECMREAFCFYFEGKAKERAKIIRLDANVWSSELEDSYVGDIKVQKTYIDERGERQYNKFKKYFEPVDYSVDI